MHFPSLDENQTILKESDLLSADKQTFLKWIPYCFRPRAYWWSNIQKWKADILH